MASKQKAKIELNISCEMVKNSIQTFTASKRYIQIMVKSIMLNIIYQRMEIISEDLKFRKYENIPFVVFRRRNLKDPALHVYTSVMAGIQESIVKNYLKEIYIMMVNRVTNEAIESYKLSLQYNKDNKSANGRTPEHIKDVTMALLEAVIELGKIEKVPKNTDLIIEVTYFDDTPEDYEPKNFEKANKPFCFRLPKYNRHLGTLNTGFHRLNCYGEGNLLKFTPTTSLCDSNKENANQDMEVIQTTYPTQQPTSELLSHSPIINVVDIPPYEPPNIFNTSGITVSDRAEFSKISVDSFESEIYSPSNSLKCLCQLAIPLDVDVVHCSSCERQYHAPCHGFLSMENYKREEFICFYCGTTDNVILHFQEGRALFVFAKIRLILYYLYKTSRVPDEVLSSINEDDKERISKSLQSYSIYVFHLDVGGEGSVDGNKLNYAMKLFFDMNDSQFFS